MRDDRARGDRGGDDARNGPVTVLQTPDADPAVANAGWLAVSRLYVDEGTLGVQPTGGTLAMSSVQVTADSGLVVEATDAFVGRVERVHFTVR